MAPKKKKNPWEDMGGAASLLTAAAILLAAPLSASSVTGKVIEGPSNAEMVELTLNPREQVITDTNTILYVSDKINYNYERRRVTSKQLRLTDKRISVNAYTNEGSEPGTIGLATQLPSRIVPIQLEMYGKTLIANTRSILAAPYEVDLDFEQGYAKDFTYFKTERISGSGTVYLAGSGNILAKQLKAGETLKLYPGAWVAMTDQVTMKFAQTKMFRGKLLEVEGPGTLWIDTAPVSRIVDSLDSLLPRH